MKLTYQAHAVTRYSRHADVRMRQRRIPAAAIDLLLDFGEPTHAEAGARRYRFTRSSWAEAQAALGAAASTFAKYRNAYVVEGDAGVVITAAWLN